MSPLFSVFDLRRLMDWVSSWEEGLLAHIQEKAYAFWVSCLETGSQAAHTFFLFLFFAKATWAVSRELPFLSAGASFRSSLSCHLLSAGSLIHLYKLAIVLSTSGTWCCSLLLNIFLLSTYHNSKCYIFFSVLVFPSQIGAPCGQRIWSCFAHSCISSVHHRYDGVHAYSFFRSCIQRLCEPFLMCVLL